MKLCPDCGSLLEVGSRFCGNCGCPILEQPQASFCGIESDPVKLVISRGITTEGKVTIRQDVAYGDDSPVTIEKAVETILKATELLNKFRDADPEEDSYSVLAFGLSDIFRRLINGDCSPLSSSESDLLILAANILYQGAMVLEKEPDNLKYEEHIKKWITISHDLYLLSINNIIGKKIKEKPSEKPQPKDQEQNDKKSTDVPSSGSDIEREIKALEKELDRLCPQFKIHQYNPNKDYWKELENLTGLENVKTELREHISAFNVHKIRKEMHPGLKTEFKFNCLFKGRPGTGKTTVARILSGILRQEGMISKGQCVEVDATSITAGWVGFTPKFTRLAALKAVGGVLFIDEAYSLMTGQGGNDNRGNEAIDALTPIMTNYSEELIVILAGYDKEMEEFMSKVNTGLASRFQKNVDFQDYSGEEMLKIFLDIARDNCFELDKRAIQRLSKLLCAISSRKDKNRAFANARTVRSLFDLVRNRAAQRYLKDKSVNPDLITIEDVTVSVQELKNIGAI